MRSQIVALGLGSNLQNPIENLRRALAEIKKSSLFEVLDVASIYESDAQLPEKARSDWQQKFLNSVVLCNVNKTTDNHILAEELLREIKQIEVRIGRPSSERWAPRLIDIDILYWNLEEYHSENIDIPHARLSERPFALLPLLEVWNKFEVNFKFKMPLWAYDYIELKPFNTQKSRKYFWPKMVGILNITTDSFSDGGRFLNSKNLIDRVQLLMAQGVDVLDIGAESTRPGAATISEDEEYEKLNWALSEISEALMGHPSKSTVLISLDSRHPQVIRRILDKYQIDFLNDVSGFSNIQMKTILKESQLPAFVMHSLSIPPNSEFVLDMQKNPMTQLELWWNDRSNDLIPYCTSPDKLVFDPGIGFGKTKFQNLYILQHLEEFSKIQNSIMIGHSRKSFLSLFSERRPELRDTETALVTKDLNLAYVQYLRVHDIESQVISLKARSLK